MLNLFLSHNFSFKQGSYEEVINFYRDHDKTLVFIDPPYFKKDISRQIYEHEIDEAIFIKNITEWKKHLNLIITVGESGLDTPFSEEYIYSSARATGSLSTKNGVYVTRCYGGNFILNNLPEQNKMEEYRTETIPGMQMEATKPTIPITSTGLSLFAKKPMASFEQLTQAQNTI